LNYTHTFSPSLYELCKFSYIAFLEASVRNDGYTAGPVHCVQISGFPLIPSAAQDVGNTGALHWTIRGELKHF